jgi:Uma2 family endonuclease
MMIVDPPANLVIGVECNGVCMTPNEFDGLPDRDELYDYELINGVLVVNPPPAIEERDSCEELGHWLRNYHADHPQGAVLDATVPGIHVYSVNSRRRADRVIWTGLGRLPDVVKDVPSIAVEFVSEGRRNWMRDYIEKRDEYLALGVIEYWVIDRFARQMTVFGKTDGQVEETVVKQDGVYQTALLPGFELALAKLLAVADRWRKE